MGLLFWGARGRSGSGSERLPGGMVTPGSIGGSGTAPRNPLASRAVRARSRALTGGSPRRGWRRRGLDTRRGVGRGRSTRRTCTAGRSGSSRPARGAAAWSGVCPRTRRSGGGTPRRWAAGAGARRGDQRANRRLGRDHPCPSRRDACPNAKMSEDARGCPRACHRTTRAEMRGASDVPSWRHDSDGTRGVRRETRSAASARACPGSRCDPTRSGGERRSARATCPAAASREQE